MLPGERFEPDSPPQQAQGLKSDTIFVRTKRETCLPTVLNVNVGESSSPDGAVIFPKGTRPVFINAWKPLQIPRMSPSLSSTKPIMQAATLCSRITLAMNLAEPSGSSPAEKPPENARISARFIHLQSSSRDFSSSCLLRFLITTNRVSAPDNLKALAISYSQFVPGNTGRTARGFTVPDENFLSLQRIPSRGPLFSFSFLLKTPEAQPGMDMGGIIPETGGKTFAKGFSQFRWASSRGTVHEPAVMTGTDEVSPITYT